MMNPAEIASDTATETVPNQNGVQTYPVHSGEVETRPLDSLGTSERSHPEHPTAQPGPSRDPGTRTSVDSCSTSDIYGKGTPASTDPTDSYLTLVFRDGLDDAIPGLELFVTWPSGATSSATTHADGSISVAKPLESSGTAIVEVKDATGQRQTVCELDLERCRKLVVVRSPKVVVRLPLREHQQVPVKQVAKRKPSSESTSRPQPVPEPSLNPRTQQPSPTTRRVTSALTPSASAKHWWDQALAQAWAWLREELDLDETSSALVPSAPSMDGNAQRARSLVGQPVTVVAGPECPNKDNLKLGRNNIYRDAVMQASRRLGLIPQAICALLDCEAAKVVERIAVLDAKGLPVRDKKGRPIKRKIAEVWKADSYNNVSHAGGMTQFLRSTWLAHVMIPGRYIHEQSVRAGWVQQEAVASGKKKGSLRWVFKLADGTTTPSPSRHLGDTNVQACLAKRMDPVWSVMAAAEYGKANLVVLSKAGFNLEGLNDMEKAKLMYLLHHEGEGAGPLFISNRLHTIKGGIPKLRKIFYMQVGRKMADDLIGDAQEDVEKAYRRWLGKYIQEKFDQSWKYFCKEPIKSADLNDILKSIGGEVL